MLKMGKKKQRIDSKNCFTSQKVEIHCCTRANLIVVKINLCTVRKKLLHSEKNTEIGYS